jgi:hypothetical protein
MILGLDQGLEKRKRRAWTPRLVTAWNFSPQPAIARRSLPQRSEAPLRLLAMLAS